MPQSAASPARSSPARQSSGCSLPRARKSFARSSLSPSAEVTSRTPAARAASAVWRATANAWGAGSTAYAGRAQTGRAAGGWIIPMSVPPRRKEIGAGAELELARGFGAEARRVGDGAVTLRLQHDAAVGLGDEPAKREPAAGDGGMAGDRGAARALEHREERALGAKRRRGRSVIDGAQERKRAPVIAARVDGDYPLPPPHHN